MHQSWRIHSESLRSLVGKTIPRNGYGRLRVGLCCGLHLCRQHQLLKLGGWWLQVFRWMRLLVCCSYFTWRLKPVDGVLMASEQLRSQFTADTPISLVYFYNSNKNNQIIYSKYLESIIYESFKRLYVKLNLKYLYLYLWFLLKIFNFFYFFSYD